LIDLVPKDGFGGLFLGIEYPCRSLVFQHLFKNGRLLDHTAFRGKIAEEDGQASFLMIGGFNGPDDLPVLHNNGFKVLTQGLAGGGQAGQIQHAVIGQFLHHGRNPAGRIQVFNPVFSAGAQGT